MHLRWRKLKRRQKNKRYIADCSLLCNVNQCFTGFTIMSQRQGGLIKSLHVMCYQPFDKSMGRGGSRGRVQGVHTPPPPELTCGFLIQLVFCKKKIMWFIGVEVGQEKSAPPPKKILDPPLMGL